MPDPIARLLEHMPAIAPLMVGRFWFSVPGASKYLVSDRGEVISLVKRRPRLMKPIGMGAYRGVQLLMDDGTRRRKYMHRFVLEAFRRPGEPGEEGRHLDGTRHNNDLSNLAWGSRAENMADKIAHGTAPRGERNGQARLTRSQVEQMRCMYERGGVSFDRLAKWFGVSAMTAYRAVRRHSWK